MADNSPDDRILIGVIGKAHGIRGEVKVVPETDDPTRFRSLKRAFTASDGSPNELLFTSVRIQTSGKGLTPIVKIEGVDTREAAEALRGTGLFVASSDLPLEDGEFFLHDLIGLTVESEEDGRIGIVSDVIELPASPTLVVKRDGEENALIPLIPEFLVDVTSTTVIVRLPEGLIE